MTLDYADQKIRNRQQDSIWPLILLAAIMWTTIAVVHLGWSGYVSSTDDGETFEEYLKRKPPRHQETFDEYLLRVLPRKTFKEYPERTRSNK